MLNNIQKILLLASLNAATITSVFIHEQPINNKPEDSEIDWQIPQIPQPNLSNVQLTLWGDNFVSKKSFTTSSRSIRNRKKAKNNELTLVAIIQQGKQNYVLFTDRKKEVSKYSIGKQLPDGSKILKIKDDLIEIMRDDKVELVYLYPQKK